MVSLSLSLSLSLSDENRCNRHNTLASFAFTSSARHPYRVRHRRAPWEISISVFTRRRDKRTSDSPRLAEMGKLDNPPPAPEKRIYPRDWISRAVLPFGCDARGGARLRIDESHLEFFDASDLPKHLFLPYILRVLVSQRARVRRINSRPLDSHSLGNRNERARVSHRSLEAS